MEDENCTVTQFPMNQTQSRPPLTPGLEQATPDTKTMSENMGVGGGESELLNSVVGGSENVGSEAVGKKRRGRPRSYPVDGNLLSSATAPSSCSVGNSVKRCRGRPRGSGKLQILASIGGFFAETAGGNFTPHVVIVNTGEDVVSKIIVFSQKGQRAVCILSATGSVSSVTIRQSNNNNSSGCVIRYEGLYEIISLSGSFVVCGGNGSSGMVSVLLAKPDGKVFGGYIEGSLIAAGPIQLVVGSFKQNISKQIKRKESNEPSDAPNMSGGNSDSQRIPQLLPRMIEGEVRCISPTSGLMQTTNGGVQANVITANPNIHSVSLNGVVLDSKDQRMSNDVNISASQM